MIAAETVGKLRESTGAGLMECKRALEETSGDFDAAKEVLRKKGIATADKKAGRPTGAGLIHISMRYSKDEVAASILQLECETDFVSSNNGFAEFAAWIGNRVVLAQTLPEDVLTDVTITDTLKTKITEFGENIVIRKTERVTGTVIGSYVHPVGKRIGALLVCMGNMSQDAETAANEVCMHIAAMNPQYLSTASIPEELIEKEKRIEAERPDVLAKPAPIRDKIVTGRVNKLLADRCLLEQPFVKDSNQKVLDYLKSHGLIALRFIRYVVGDA